MYLTPLQRLSQLTKLLRNPVVQLEQHRLNLPHMQGLLADLLNHLVVQLILHSPTLVQLSPAQVLV